jgi:CBS domain-containing protein
MHVRDICSRVVVSIGHDATPAEAARLMREHHVGALVVTDRSSGAPAVVGLVTDRDLATGVLARGADAPHQIGPLVSGPPVSVPESADLAEALSRMRSHGVRRLLVTTPDEHLAGVLSLDDLLPALAQPFAALAELLRVGQEKEAVARAAKPAPPLPRLRIPSIGTAGWQPR